MRVHFEIRNVVSYVERVPGEHPVVSPYLNAALFCNSGFILASDWPETVAPGPWAPHFRSSDMLCGCWTLRSNTEDVGNPREQSDQSESIMSLSRPPHYYTVILTVTMAVDRKLHI